MKLLSLLIASLMALFLSAYCEEDERKVKKLTQKQMEDFEFLMGKKTPYWKYVTEQNDRAVLQKFKGIYEKNKALLQNHDQDYKIPKVIHFIWLGPKHFPPESVENVRSWIAMHPGWTVKFWTDHEDRPCPCSGMEKMLVQDYHFEKLQDIFNEAANWGQKSDILRYEILHQEGGIYVDHDIYCIKSMDTFTKCYDLYCGFRLPRQATPATDNYAILATNSLIGSKKGHPVLARTMQILMDRWERQSRPSLSNANLATIESTVFITTYMPFSLAVYEEAEKDGNVDIVFPAAYFNAQDSLPALYAKDLFAAMWLDLESTAVSDAFENQIIKKLSGVLDKSKKLGLISVITFVLSTLLLSKAVRFLLFLRRVKHEKAS